MARGLVLLPNGRAAPEQREVPAVEKAKAPDTFKSRAELVADNVALANTLAAWSAALGIIQATARDVPPTEGPLILTPLDRAMRADKKLAEIRRIAQQALSLVE